MIAVPRSRLPLLAIALTTCLAATACSSPNAATRNPPNSHYTTNTTTIPAGVLPSPVASTTITITIKNFAYTVSGTAAHGSKVMITNRDNEAHTVTADSSNAFNVTVQPGESASFPAPAASGTYKFHCSFHSNMHGTLTVVP